MVLTLTLHLMWINVNPVNPIIGGLSRSYSDDPEIVADQARQVIDGLHSENVMATLKHFPGHRPFYRRYP